MVVLGRHQSASPEAPPRKKDVRRGTIEKIWDVGVIEEKEVRGDDPIESFPWGSKVAFKSQRGDGN